MTGNPQVLGLLEEMLDSGKTPDEVCRDCPELLPEVRQLLRQQQPRPVQAALHRLLGNPDHRGRLAVRQALDADQVEDLALVLREALDRLEHAAPVRAEAGAGAVRRGRDARFRKYGGGPVI